jgi:hypothetical protein
VSRWARLWAFAKRWAPWAAGAVAVVLVAIQLVPYGRDHDNPPVTAEPAWDTPETRELAVAACFDCHSNETEWPWYSNIAPMSWLIQSDVQRGREALNLSEWDREQDEADDASDTVVDGDMPPSRYLPLHADARLSDAEQQALADGLARTIGDSEGGDDNSGSGSGGGDDDNSGSGSGGRGDDSGDDSSGSG